MKWTKMLHGEVLSQWHKKNNKGRTEEEKRHEALKKNSQIAKINPRISIITRNVKELM